MTHNKSLDASGGSASRNLLDWAKGALIRAAASTLTLCGLHGSTVMWLTWFRSDTNAPGSPKRGVMLKLTWLALIVFSVLSYASAQQVHSIANLVERIVREKEPSFTLISRGFSGR